jgi:hypothetical protein
LEFDRSEEVGPAASMIMAVINEASCVKICVVIPTYWASKSLAIKQQRPTATYDHPTPVESLSTLPRLLDSLKKTDLPSESTTIFVTVATTHQTVEKKASEITKEILKGYEDSFEIAQFSSSTLKRLNSEDKTLARLVNMSGYSNVRNVGLAISQIMNADILYFLDDDVVVSDKHNFQKIQQFAGKEIGGKLLGGVAGYYVNEEGGYYLNVDPAKWWKTGWPKERKMNEAFKILESRERLTDTTFAFGGCMVLHWKMFEKVPFDPSISRGEDMDLLVDAKMHGFGFKLDTELKVVHIPGEGKSQWSEMRQDLYRFLYMRQKLFFQKNFRDVENVSIDSLKPYPGHFLIPRTCLNFTASSWLESLHSVLEGDRRSFIEFMRNIQQIPSALRFARRHCLDYFDFQKKWSEYVPKIRDNRSLKSILKGQL